MDEEGNEHEFGTVTRNIRPQQKSTKSSATQTKNLKTKDKIPATGSAKSDSDEVADDEDEIGENDVSVDASTVKRPQRKRISKVILDIDLYTKHNLKIGFNYTENKCSCQ